MVLKNISIKYYLFQPTQMIYIEKFNILSPKDANIKKIIFQNTIKPC